jgi:hypothetical protein
MPCQQGGGEVQLFITHVLGVLENGESMSLQFGRGLLFLTTSLLDGFAQQLHHVKLVEGDRSIRKAVLASGNVCGGHVDADLINLIGIRPMLNKVPPELLDRFTLSAIGHEQDLPLVQIRKHSHVVMALAYRLVVDPDSANLRVVAPGDCLVDVVVNHTPQSRVVLTDKPGDRANRHVPRHCQDERFEQQSESASRPAPRNIHGTDSTSRTIDSRNSSVQDRLVLKEVQMTPLSLLGVIRLATSRAAFGTSERSSTTKVDADLEMFGFSAELKRGDVPRFGKAKRESKELILFHRGRVSGHWDHDSSGERQGGFGRSATESSAFGPYLLTQPERRSVSPEGP